MKTTLKIALLLFFVLLGCNCAFAYEVKITKLTDIKYPPIFETEDVGIYDSIDKYKVYSALTNNLLGITEKDIQIATVTLVFGLHEIGQDKDAVVKLAQTEAHKLGADCIVYVSDAQHKDTQEIASMTFRFVRRGMYEYFFEKGKREYISKKSDYYVKEELKASLFFKKFLEIGCFFERTEDEDGIHVHSEVLLKILGIKQKKEKKETSKIIEEFQQSLAQRIKAADRDKPDPLKQITEFEKREKAGIRFKENEESLSWDHGITRDNKCTAFITYFDEKTGKQLNCKEFSRRYRELFADKLISLFKENFKIYLSEKDTLLSVLQEYKESIYSEFFDCYIFNKLDLLKENIDYENWKVQFVSQTESWLEPYCFISYLFDIGDILHKRDYSPLYDWYCEKKYNYPFKNKANRHK